MTDAKREKFVALAEARTGNAHGCARGELQLVEGIEELSTELDDGFLLDPEVLADPDIPVLKKLASNI